MNHSEKTTAGNKLILFISIGLYLTSLTQPAFHHSNGESPASYLMLLTGPLGILVEAGTIIDYFIHLFTGPRIPFPEHVGGCFSWFANPLILFAWFFYYRYPKTSLTISSMALFFILLFILRGTFLSDEAGHYSFVTSPGPGYYLWFSSAAIIMIASLIRIRSESAKKEDISR